MISFNKNSISHINSSIPSLPQGLAELSGTQLPNGDLLVCGGWTGFVVSNQYLHFKKDSNNWTKVGAMLMDRNWHSSVWIDGRLLTTGGLKEDHHWWRSGPRKISSHHEEFSFDGGVKEMKEMPIALMGHTATIFDQNKMMVCGGIFFGDFNKKVSKNIFQITILEIKSIC